MPLLVYGIGFVICYFAIGFNWWMSLLIALAFPATLTIALYVIGIPLLGIGVGISTLIDRIRPRRRERYPESNWNNADEVVDERQGMEEPLITQSVYSKSPTLVQAGTQRKEQSNTLGIWSLATGIVGLFIWPSAIAAIVLGALQFKRHVSKSSIAGFILGIIDMVLFFMDMALVAW